jgi:hypothetical protein
MRVGSSIVFKEFLATRMKIEDRSIQYSLGVDTLKRIWIITTREKSKGKSKILGMDINS